MFWVDQVAAQLKKRKLPLEWVDDMKTPSGSIHVGSLRGVVIHDLLYKALLDAGVKAKYTFIFDDHDPMDDLPAYLSKEQYERHLGMPLFKVPSPDDRAENYARYYAGEFQEIFNSIGCNPEVLWGSEFYMSGKMNDCIKICLDNAQRIREIYQELYKKEMAKDWYPFQVYCPNCGKMVTTKVTNWDGKGVTFACRKDALPWTKGCGMEGKVSPFSSKSEMRGKLLWKVEWACKWKVLGVTVEGAGKDHMSKGGSHDLASLVAKRVLNYPVPFAVAYEWFLLHGKKMSTSRGVGFSAKEMSDILPPDLLRFLMVRTRIDQAINFDPTEPQTIPRLFDEYDRYQQAYRTKSDEEMARIFELSQVGKVDTRRYMRFSDLVNLLQMPGKEKELESADVAPRVQYAKIWLERFAPEKDRFTVKEEFPEEALHLSGLQKMYIAKVAAELGRTWEPERFQKRLYEIAKESGPSSKEAFSALYLSLIGKDHGPKAAWLILSLNREFVRNRFQEASK